MADLNRMIQALKAADAAGDVQAAQALAAAIRAQRAQDASQGAQQGAGGAGSTLAPGQQTAPQDESPSNLSLEGALRNAGGGLDVATRFVGSAIGEPIAGLAGIAGSLLPGPEGQGAQVVEKVRGFFGQGTGQLVDKVAGTDFSKRGAEFMQATGEAISPAAEKVDQYTRWLSDRVQDKALDAGLSEGLSSTLATVAYTAPTAALELLTRGGGRAAKRAVDASPDFARAVPTTKGIRDAAESRLSKAADVELRNALPTVKEIEDFKAELYAPLHNADVRMDNRLLGNMINDIRRKSAQYVGTPADSLPMSNGVLDNLTTMFDQGADLFIDHVDNVRSDILARLPNATGKDSSRLMDMLDTIENYMDPDVIRTRWTGDPVQKHAVMPQLRLARELNGRAARAKIVEGYINEAADADLFDADPGAAVRMSLARLYRKAKKGEGEGRYFTGYDKAALRAAAERNNVEKMIEFIGGSSISPNSSAASALRGGFAPSAGAAFGAGVGGVPGAIIGAAAGQAAGWGARRITDATRMGKAKEAAAAIAAGERGRNIAEAYLRGVPVGNRSTEHLKNLLLGRAEPDFGSFNFNGVMQGIGGFGDNAFVQDAARRALDNMTGYAILGIGAQPFDAQEQQ